MRERVLSREMRETLHLERAGGVDGAGVDLVAEVLADRHRFAGDRGLVAGRFALVDDAIGGDALARADEHDVADLELVDRDDGLAAVGGEEGGFFRGEVHQGADRAAGAAEGIVFQRIGEGEEPEEDGAFFPVVDGGRADGRQHHEQVDADFAFGQQLERGDGGEGAAEEVGEDEEPVGERVWARPAGACRRCRKW